MFDSSVSATGARFLNISALNFAGSGNSTLTAGFVVKGSGTITLLIRGVGPELALSFGVTGVLADPQIVVRGADTTNDDWDGSLTDVMASVGAFPLAAGSKDAAARVLGMTNN